MIGVAISTTGDPHRLRFLETCVRKWDEALPPAASLFVTVDGDEDATLRAAEAVHEYTESVFRVGQPTPFWNPGPFSERKGRLGVSANKNTGLELLMDTRVNHLFLSDDDTWPLSSKSLTLHTELGLPHSMVCWGRHRRPICQNGYAEWTWPRGVALYAHRFAVDRVGGMIEAFGPGGHEHVEWSRRIHQAVGTPALFPSPAEYSTRNAMGALAYWHAEDAPRRSEPLGNLRQRRRALTTVHREPGDWALIEKIMADRDGDTGYVPFRAHANGRSSATMAGNLMGRGAQAKEPGSQG